MVPSARRDIRAERQTIVKKTTKSGSQEGKAGADSPSQLIDARIEELGDWRGEMLARSETSSARLTPTSSRR